MGWHEETLWVSERVRRTLEEPRTQPGVSFQHFISFVDLVQGSFNSCLHLASSFTSKLNVTKENHLNEDQTDPSGPRFGGSVCSTKDQTQHSLTSPFLDYRKKNLSCFGRSHSEFPGSLSVFGPSSYRLFPDADTQFYF